VDNVKRLASQPGVTPERIRQELDEILSPSAFRATLIMAKRNRNCAVALDGLPRTLAELLSGAKMTFPASPAPARAKKRKHRRLGGPAGSGEHR